MEKNGKHGDEKENIETSSKGVLERGASPFAQCLAEIEGRRLKWAPRVLERRVQMGYVYVIGDSTVSYIGWAGSTKIKDVLAQLQKGNPHNLKVAGVMLRSNVYDARGICDVIHEGLILKKIRGRWYDVMPAAVVSAYTRINQCQESVLD
jgi:hypothetical protein